MALRLSVLACTCSAFLVTSTVTALAVLNGWLRSLDVCRLWFLGLWHEACASVRDESARSHPSPEVHTRLVWCVQMLTSTWVSGGSPRCGQKRTRGVKNYQIFVDVLYGRTLIHHRLYYFHNELRISHLIDCIVALLFCFLIHSQFIVMFIQRLSKTVDVLRQCN